MNRNFLISIVTGLTFGFAGGASAGDTLGVGDLEFGQSREQTRVALEKFCDQVDPIIAEPVQFPLAAATEEHLRCRGLQTGDGVIAQSVFVIADNVLAMAELRGGAIDALVSSRSDDAMPYLHYLVFDHGRLIADAKSDAVWLLSKDALHPNLFTWSNPYLDALDGNGPVYDASGTLPGFIRFGATLDELRPQFEANCPIMNVENIEKVWLSNQPAKQTQVNCFGLEYAGFPRKFEAVFGDDKLELIWILTGKPEEGRIRDALNVAYGSPDEINAKWEVFDGGAIALRKDKPEILAISPELIPHYFESLETK